MTEFEKWSIGISFCYTLLTFIAVIVAICGEKIRKHFDSPRLTIRLDEPALNTTIENRKGWYYLLCVKNEKLSSPAKNVRVLLTRVLIKGDDGAWHEKFFSGPTQVTWRWPDYMPLYLTVGPEERATFGYLQQHSNAFCLSMYFFPNNLKSELPSGKPTRFEFKADSDTAQSEAIIVEILWDGKWSEDRGEMRNHLRVKQITE